MNYWIKLPNNLVWSYEADEVPLINDYNKLLVTMVYLDVHINNINECCWTLENMIKDCGFEVRTGKGRSIEQFKSALLYLQTLGWLDSTLDIINLKPKDYVCCKYEVKFIQDDADNDTCFFRLFYSSYRKIMDSDSQLDKILTLKIYCYIIARIKRNSNEANENKKVQWLEGSVVECFYDSYIAICRGLDIVDNTFKAHIDLLKELELIYFDNIGLVKDDFGSHSANNVYAEDKEELTKGLKCSKEYYIGKGYNIVGKKCSKETNKIKGYKGQIEKQTNEGKDTTKLEDKLEELEESKQEFEFKDNVRVIKIKPRKGIGKQLEYRSNIACNEDNYFEISNKLKND